MMSFPPSKFSNWPCQLLKMIRTNHQNLPRKLNHPFEAFLQALMPTTALLKNSTSGSSPWAENRFHGLKQPKSFNPSSGVMCQGKIPGIPASHSQACFRSLKNNDHETLTRTRRLPRGKRSIFHWGSTLDFFSFQLSSFRPHLVNSV